MGKVILMLLFAIAITCALEQVNKDDFTEFLLSRDRSEQHKVDFVATKKWTNGYVGKYKIRAITPIKEGEVIYSNSLQDDTINIDVALNDPIIGSTLKELSLTEQEKENKTEELFLYDDHIINLYLIHLKNNPDPQWQSYINALPTKLDTPLFWTDDEVEELVGTSLYKSATKWRNSILLDYQAVITNISAKYPEKFPSSQYTLDAYKWARSVYGGRLWYRTKLFNPVLPLTEVFNFKEIPSAKIEVDDESQILKVIALEDIAIGEEIFVSDGKLSNGDLLDYYGFVLGKNDEDSIEVGVGLDPADKLYSNKKSLLRQKGIKDGQVFKIKRNEIPDDLIFGLRIFHLSVYDYDDHPLAFQNKVISLQNEIMVADTLIEMCRSTLTTFKTTNKEDKALLETEISKRLRNAIILRRAEKKILLRTLKTAKSIKKQVQSKWDMRTMDIPGSKDFNMREIV